MSTSVDAEVYRIPVPGRGKAEGETCKRAGQQVSPTSFWWGRPELHSEPDPRGAGGWSALGVEGGTPGGWPWSVGSVAVDGLEGELLEVGGAEVGAVSGEDLDPLLSGFVDAGVP